MKQNLINKPCPTCKTQIGIGLFSNREEIIRCPKCKELLIENPKRKLLGSIIFFLGIFIGIGSREFIGISSIWGILIFILSIIIMLRISNLIIIKKDLVIKNRATNAISYIDHVDWNEILSNTSGRENSFEIIEELK